MGLLLNTTGYRFFVVAQRPHHCCTGAHVLVGGVFDDGGRMHEEFVLLFAFLLERGEVLVVLMPDIGDHSDSRTDDTL